MAKESKEEDPIPEMTLGTGRGREDTQIGVTAEKEVEEIEQPELRCSAMENQVVPEGVARRPNVWWGLQ